MFKEMLPYQNLQVLFGEEEIVSPQQRLEAARGPLLSWYRRHHRKLPWRENLDAYRIWISEIMLQQTRVEAVKPYYARFMEQFPTVEALAAAPEEDLLKAWEGLGYYSRAKNLQKAARVVVSEYGGKLPPSRDELLKLPGIGSYTAGAIASIAYGLPVPAVDGNVLRVLSRVIASREDIMKQSVKKQMEQLVQAVIPEKDAGDYNQALIETGALLCLPGKEPLCEDCPFSTVCLAKKQGLLADIPVRTQKKQRKIEELTVLLIEYRDKIAIRKRADAGLLASLYEFPNLPGSLGEREVKDLFPDAEAIETLPDAKHVFSHVEWHMAGYFVQLQGGGEMSPADCIFVEKSELREKYPIPNAFAKYKQLLEKS